MKRVIVEQPIERQGREASNNTMTIILANNRMKRSGLNFDKLTDQ